MKKLNLFLMFVLVFFANKGWASTLSPVFTIESKTLSDVSDFNYLILEND